MKINRIVLSIVVILGLVVSGFIFGGISSVNASLDASLGAVICSFVISSIAIFFPRQKRTLIKRKPVGLIRRYFAAMIDFVVIISFFTSLYAPIVASLEFASTGVWQWSYERTEWQTRDIFGILLGFLMFPGIFYYFYKHHNLSRETVGQYIAGYKIIDAANGKPPNYIGRLGDSLVVAAFWLFVPLFTRGVKNGVYPWDKRTNTRAVRTIP